jgi:hypothetical protein
MQELKNSIDPKIDRSSIHQYQGYLETNQPTTQQKVHPTGLDTKQNKQKKNTFTKTN